MDSEKLQELAAAIQKKVWGRENPDEDKSRDFANITPEQARKIVENAAV